MMCITQGAAFNPYTGKNEIVNVTKMMTLPEFADLITIAEMIKSEYGDKFIESYEVDIDMRKVCAEIDLQTTRMEEAKKIVNECEDFIADSLYQIALHGREIGAFSKDADLKTFSQNIHNMIIGLDKSFICNIKIDARKIWKFNIDAMFALSKEIR